MTVRPGVRRVAVVAAVVLALAAVGAGLATLLLPTRVTAESRLVVGSQGLYAQQVPGYVDATVSLAQTYARFVTDGAIGTERGPGVSAIRATAIATTPIVRIEADADTREHALAAATKAATGLQQAVTAASGTSSADKVSKDLTDANTALTQAKSEVTAARAGGDPAKVASAENAQLLAQLKVNGLSTAYQNLVATTGSPSTDVALLQAATVTTAQSSRPMALGAVLGALVGLGGAGVLSMLRRNRSNSPYPSEHLE